MIATRMTILAVSALALTACARGSKDRHEGHQHEKPTQDKKNHEGHDHEGHDHDRTTFTPEAIAAAQKRQCEHNKQILDCDDCRYEAGVVQLPKAMVNSSNKEGLVRTAKVQSVAAASSLSATGEVTFDERKLVHISPRVSGVARQVHVTLGDRVKKGAQLVQMDSLELGKLRARLLQSRERLALARRDHERERRLFVDKISSGKDSARAETAFKRAQIELRAVSDQLRLLGLSPRQLEQIGRSGNGRMAIRSPRVGTVVAKHVVPGEQIKPDKVIITVADLTTVWVWASVYERDLARLLAATSQQSKPKATVRVDAFAGRRFTGVVDYIGATMDESTRTVKVRVVVQNDGHLLRPGMFANLQMDLGKGEQMLAIPDAAVVRDEGKHFVFVRLGDSGRFARRDVQVGTSATAGQIEIREGLKAGEEIVVSGAFLLKSDILREKMGAGCAD